MNETQHAPLFPAYRSNYPNSFWSMSREALKIRNPIPGSTRTVGNDLLQIVEGKGESGQNTQTFSFSFMPFALLSLIESLEDIDLGVRNISKFICILLYFIFLISDLDERGKGVRQNEIGKKNPKNRRAGETMRKQRIQATFKELHFSHRGVQLNEHELGFMG